MEMTRAEFMEKYRDAKVKFSSYYKYTFTFTGSLPGGDRIVVEVGGDSDDIYKMEVVPDYEETVASLEPIGGAVYSTNGTVVDSFYDY